MVLRRLSIPVHLGRLVSPSAQSWREGGELS